MQKYNCKTPSVKVLTHFIKIIVWITENTIFPENRKNSEVKINISAK